MTTFRIPAVALALAASLGASVSLGNPSAPSTDARPVPLPMSPARTDGKSSECRIAGASPTAEAGFAIRRPVVDARR